MACSNRNAGRYRAGNSFDVSIVYNPSGGATFGPMVATLHLETDNFLMKPLPKIAPK